jgi:hypothetical protein
MNDEIFHVSGWELALIRDSLEATQELLQALKKAGLKPDGFKYVKFKESLDIVRNLLAAVPMPNGKERI